jgi:hypothetical protein
VTCSLQRLSKAQVKFLGLAWPPPKGFTWDAITCPGPVPFAAVTLVNIATGAPGITPQQLLQTALAELFIAAFPAATAPPRGKDALVGLPEWFWIPRADWRQATVTVTAGPVWVTAAATPMRLTFSPGSGQAPVSCAGPGTPYQPRLALAAQHTACAFTYTRSSAGQPGSVFRAAVTVTWRVAWTGSGGTGGVLNAALQVPYAFTVPVANGEALVTGGDR